MPIRTAVLGFPQMFSDVLHQAFDAPPDLELVAVDTTPLDGDGARLSALVSAAHPDAVLAGLNGVHDEILIGNFAAEHCEVTVLGITIDGTRAWVVRLRPDFEPITEISPDSLRACVRRAVERHR